MKTLNLNSSIYMGWIKESRIIRKSEAVNILEYLIKEIGNREYNETVNILASDFKVYEEVVLSITNSALYSKATKKVTAKFRAKFRNTDVMITIGMDLDDVPNGTKVIINM